jgi:hypothetical protein
MDAFLIDLENKPGELARIAEAIAAKGVNITGLAGSSCGQSGRVTITTADPVTTRQVLGDAKASYKVYEVTETALADKPGTLAQALRRLADRGVNVEAVMPTGMSGSTIQVGFVTNDPARAKEALQAVGASR